MASPLDEPILELLETNGEMHSNEIIAEFSEHKAGTIRSRLSKLKDRGKIDMPEKGLYVLVSTSTKARPDAELKNISEALRSADANKKTIDRLMNIYDGVLDNYETWVRDNVGSGTNFADQLLFIENFKWLTAIGDKLMKRWSLEHVGYDTNSRQAQEDAKAKTEAREQEVLKNAPLEDKIVVVGHYKEGFQEILEHLPKKEVEDISV